MSTLNEEQLTADTSEHFGESENQLFASIKWNSTPDSSNSSKFSSSHENKHISLGMMYNVVPNVTSMIDRIY